MKRFLLGNISAVSSNKTIGIIHVDKLSKGSNDCVVAALSLCRAILLQQNGRCLVVDADFISPCTGEKDFPQSPTTLYQLLKENNASGDIIAAPLEPYIDFLAAGDNDAQCLSLLTGNNMKKLITQLSSLYTTVVFNFPNAFVFPGISITLRMLDSVLLYLVFRTTRIETVIEQKRRLDSAGIPLRGAILDKRKLYVPEWIYWKL